MKRTNKLRGSNEMKGINSENAKSAFKFYSEENPKLAERIALKYNLIEDLINLYSTNGEYLRAAYLSENKGLIKKAIDFYEKVKNSEDQIEYLKSLVRGSFVVDKLNPGKFYYNLFFDKNTMKNTLSRFLKGLRTDSLINKSSLRDWEPIRDFELNLENTLN